MMRAKLQEMKMCAVCTHVPRGSSTSHLLAIDFDDFDRSGVSLHKLCPWSFNAVTCRVLTVGNPNGKLPCFAFMVCQACVEHPPPCEDFHLDHGTILLEASNLPCIKLIICEVDTWTKPSLPAGLETVPNDIFHVLIRSCMPSRDRPFALCAWPPQPGPRNDTHEECCSETYLHAKGQGNNNRAEHCQRAQAACFDMHLVEASPSGHEKRTLATHISKQDPTELHKRVRCQGGTKAQDAACSKHRHNE